MILADYNIPFSAFPLLQRSVVPLCPHVLYIVWDAMAQTAGVQTTGLGANWGHGAGEHNRYFSSLDKTGSKHLQCGGNFGLL